MPPTCVELFIKIIQDESFEGILEVIIIKHAVIYR
jgi:hypothetical protein